MHVLVIVGFICLWLVAGFSMAMAFGRMAQIGKRRAWRGSREDQFLNARRLYVED